MKTSEILSAIADHNIKLWVEDKRLRFRAPKGSLTPQLRTLLEKSRDRLLKELTNKSEAMVSSHPLSHNQQFLWFLYQLAPKSAAYNVAFAARVVSEINPHTTLTVLHKLINRHPILRTTYSSIDGDPIMNIHTTMEPAFEYIEAAHLSEKELHLMVNQKYAMPFNITSDPPIRVHLFTRSSKDHVLLITIHHIACDGWSMGILLKEFQQFYQTGTKTDILPPQSRYTEYIRYQTEMLNSEEGEHLKNYWLKQLTGDLPVLDLPIDKPRPPSQSYSGSTHHFTLCDNIYPKIIKFAKDEGVTLYTLLLAAFQTLLMRYSSQEDILIGTPVACRTRTECESTVGCFINSVVLRGNLSGNPPFKELLLRTRRIVMTAVENQAYPFPLLVNNLNPSRESSRSPLFQVMFNLVKSKTLGQFSDLFYTGKIESYNCEEVDFGALKLKPFPLDQQEGQFDLVLEMVDNGKSLNGILKYNTDLFEPASINRMAGHLHILLHSIVESPSRPLSELTFLTESERHKLLIEWNETTTDYQEVSSLHALIEEQVRHTPGSTAVVFEGKKLTYRDLDVRANQLAHHLRSLGAGPETLVGVYMERSLEMVIAVYGILKAGCAYVPLDPEFPPERISYMIDDSQIKILVTQKALQAQLSERDLTLTIVSLDRDLEALSKEATEPPLNNVTSNNLAYVIYTSGSTGRPKGVKVQHGAAVNLLCSMQHRPGIGCQDTLLAVTTLSFDISVLEIFLPLTVGAKTVIVPRKIASDGPSLHATLKATGATIMQGTPTTWRLLISAGWQGNGTLKALCGGETLLEDLAGDIIERSGSLWNMYGPTETTVWSTCYHMTDAHGPVLVGRPIANTKIYVLDKYFNPVPIGIPGEIFIGGKGVALGYLHQPKLTAEKFIPDLFRGDPKALLYKTGDLGRYLPDGNIQLFGRIDHQVKIRGYRIELGEVEAFLKTHPFVHEAIVVAHQYSTEDRRLIAYLVPHQDRKIPITELQRHLAQTLPSYMIPSHFVITERVPLTPNGKIDRRALPPPDNNRPELEEPYVAPHTRIERLITDLWCEILKLSRVGIHDNFFELGGNSLLSLQVIAQVKQTFDTDISVIKLFQYPTISSLAKYLDQNKGYLPSYRKVRDRGIQRKVASKQRKQPIT